MRFPFFHEGEEIKSKIQLKREREASKDWMKKTAGKSWWINVIRASWKLYWSTMNGKNGFEVFEISKNSTRYRFENNYVRSLK